MCCYLLRSSCVYLSVAYWYRYRVQFATLRCYNGNKQYVFCVYNCIVLNRVSWMFFGILSALTRCFVSHVYVTCSSEFIQLTTRALKIIMTTLNTYERILRMKHKQPCGIAVPNCCLENTIQIIEKKSTSSRKATSLHHRLAASSLQHILYR